MEGILAFGKHRTWNLFCHFDVLQKWLNQVKKKNLDSYGWQVRKITNIFEKFNEKQNEKKAIWKERSKKMMTAQLQIPFFPPQPWSEPSLPVLGFFLSVGFSSSSSSSSDDDDDWGSMSKWIFFLWTTRALETFLAILRNVGRVSMTW